MIILFRVDKVGILFSLFLARNKIPLVSFSFINSIIGQHLNTERICRRFFFQIKIKTVVSIIVRSVFLTIRSILKQ